LLKVVTYLTENCVDRHAELDPQRVALLWERDEPGRHVSVTYGQLASLVARAANAFKRAGIKKGGKCLIEHQ